MFGMKNYYLKAVQLLGALFGISRTEAVGFVLLIPLVFVLVTTPLWYKHVRQATSASTPSADYRAEFEQWRASVAEASMPLPDESETAEKRRVIPVQFDPNTASEALLLQVGFSSSLAARVVSYRNAGGKFRIKSDLLKMRGMPEELVSELWEYIDLPESKPASISGVAENVVSQDFQKRNNAPSTTDLNLATAEDLAIIRGIGPAISTRIVKYRDALGGFVSLDQLHEVWGLEPHLVEAIAQRFTIGDTASIVKLPVNSANAATLELHPYISRKLASVIVMYRVQNGNYTNIEQLKNIRILQDSIYQKLVPYIQID